MAFTDTINTTKRFKVGTRRQVDAKEFIYLSGIGSTVAGSWVAYDNLYATTLTVAASRGGIAVAQAATVASTFGWYQIYGVTTIGKVLTGANAAHCWVCATAGSVDNTDVALQGIVGAVQRSATVANVATFHINFPFVVISAID